MVQQPCPTSGQQWERKQMPQLMITDLGGNQPSSPEEGKERMEEYQECFLVSPMNRAV